MWHTIVAAWLSKAALPVIGGAVAVVVGLSAYSWWQTSRLSDVRDRLAVAKRDTEDCISANERAVVTIAELTEAAERNRTQRQEAIRRQNEALDRIAALEQNRREQADDQIERVIRIADGDACAGTAIPARLRDAASSNTD